MATVGNLAGESAFARFGDQILLSVYDFGLSGVSTSTWRLQCSQVFHSSLCLDHIWTWVHQVAHLTGILLLLNSLQLGRVRCCHVACAPCSRSLCCIFNLCASQRLRYLLVFALILNFDVCCRRVTSVVGSPFTRVVIDFAYFLHAILLAHVERFMWRTSHCWSLRVTICPGLSSACSMAEEHHSSVSIVTLAIVVHICRLSWVYCSVLLQSNFGNLRSRRNPRTYVAAVVCGNSRHIGRVDIVDGVCTLACIEAGVHKLLGLVFGVDLSWSCP